MRRELYKTLMSYAADEEIGDFTDVMAGRDLNVEVVQGNPYPETTIRPRMQASALSDDNVKVETWLKTQPKADDSFTKYSFDFIKKQLTSYLDPEADLNSPAPAAPVEVQAPANNFTVQKATESKPSTATKFDDLFSGDNDLPF